RALCPVREPSAATRHRPAAGSVLRARAARGAAARFRRSYRRYRRALGALSLASLERVAAWHRHPRRLRLFRAGAGTARLPDHRPHRPFLPYKDRREKSLAGDYACRARALIRFVLSVLHFTARAAAARPVGNLK